MAWIRLIEDYGNHAAGEKVDFPAVLARQLCKEGKAVCGVLLNSPVEDVMRYMGNFIRSQPENEKKEETKEVVYPKRLKPFNGTVKEIKAYLDKNGIKYPSQARKSELIKLMK